MTTENYIFYTAILIGNVLLAVEWAKYGLLECATIKNRRFMLGMLINTTAIFTIAIHGNFLQNKNANIVIIGFTIAVFFTVRLSLPPGKFAYNKASQRIIHWHSTSYSYGKILQRGEMLKKFPLAKNTLRLMEVAIEHFQKKNTVSGKLDLALSHEWLGSLYRMMNEFEKAGTEFDIALSILEGLSTKNTKSREIRNALGHVVFRLAELDHVQKRYQEALHKYQESLNIDESLGLHRRVKITRELMEKVIK